MRELLIVPGRSLGPFVLGTPLRQVLDSLMTHERDFPAVEVLFADSAADDVVLDLKTHSVVLRFSGEQQTLSVCHMYDLTAARLRYGASVFSSKGKPSFSALYSVFGPSYPGEFSPESRTYWLSYPGLTFALRASGVRDGVPEPPPEQEMVTASDCYVFVGQSMGSRERVSLEKTRELPGCSHYFEPVVARPRHGVTFVDRGVEVCLGDTAQSVLCSLGDPEAEVETREDKLRIHSAEGQQSTRIWNYFFSGVDFVFDALSHRVLKIVLHSNWPGHPGFQHYARANWRLTSGVSFLTSWEEARRVLRIAADTQPLVNVATLFYGTDDGIILETMKNGALASLTLF